MLPQSGSNLRQASNFLPDVENEGDNAMYWLGGILLVVFVIPNTTNFKERQAFSDARRLQHALEIYQFDQVDDSVTLTPGAYYKRGAVAALFLGKKQRELWTTPVTVKVFQYEKAKGGLTPYDFGGGQQTISIKLEDQQGRKWSLRSVNKDQQYVLPKILRITFMRFLTRDQLASANPCSQLVVPDLAEAIGVHHASPELVLIPYNEKYGKYNERMAGRLAYLEESFNSSWKDSRRFGSPKDILDTQEMLEMQKEETIPLDTTLYLKTRLFDMLISDWDRHGGNWEWALMKDGEGKIFEPIPKDRDNVFFQFDEGLVSRITLFFVPKFQSFRKEFRSVSGLMYQSRQLDHMILRSVKKQSFQQAADEIRRGLTDDVISKAFHRYPPNIYEKVGKAHEEILKARLKQLPNVASKFYLLLQEK